VILLSLVLYSLNDFGGVYWVDYYGTKYWVYLYFDHIISGPFMGLTVILFLGIMTVLSVALFSKKFGTRKAPYIISMVLLGIIFLISFLGMMAVAIAGWTGDYDDWWWDTACFVGNISPILGILMLIFPLSKVARSEKNKIEE
jgi:hypothetical protein